VIHTAPFLQPKRPHCSLGRIKRAFLHVLIGSLPLMGKEGSVFDFRPRKGSVIPTLRSHRQHILPRRKRSHLGRPWKEAVRDVGWQKEEGGMSV